MMTLEDKALDYSYLSSIGKTDLYRIMSEYEKEEGANIPPILKNIMVGLFQKWHPLVVTPAFKAGYKAKENEDETVEEEYHM